jgi:hypothetical protein
MLTDIRDINSWSFVRDQLKSPSLGESHLELRISPIEEIRIRVMLYAPRKLDPHPMETLNSIPQCRPIALPKNIGPNLDDIVRAQADKELVERHMVEIAESQTVSNNRLSLRL